MIDEKELSYWAGLFDGDGGISIGARGLLAVTIACQKVLAEQALSYWSSGKLSHMTRVGESHFSLGRPVTARVDVFEARWQNQSARAILESIGPYLRQKPEQAVIALRFLEEQRAFRCTRYAGQRKSEAELQSISRYRNLLSEARYGVPAFIGGGFGRQATVLTPERLLEMEERRSRSVGAI